MANRKKSYEPKEYESAKHGKQEPFSAVYLSMIESEAWRTLKPRQRDLYVHCKLQLHADNKSVTADERKRGYFTFNRYKWLTKYELYSEANKGGFYRDMDALIMTGFVDCVKPGQRTREKNIYKLSDRWQHYGLETYVVPPQVMTASVYRKQYSAVGKSTQGKWKTCRKKYTRCKATARRVVWKSTQPYEYCVSRVV